MAGLADVIAGSRQRTLRLPVRAIVRAVSPLPISCVSAPEPRLIVCAVQEDAPMFRLCQTDGFDLKDRAAAAATGDDWPLRGCAGRGDLPAAPSGCGLIFDRLGVETDGAAGRRTRTKTLSLTGLDREYRAADDTDTANTSRLRMHRSLPLRCQAPGGGNRAGATLHCNYKGFSVMAAAIAAHAVPQSGGEFWWA